MNHFPDDEQFDPTVDRLLQQAFTGRQAAAPGSASLTDVRARARRHQRRRAGAMVGAAAVVGIGGVGVLSQRGDGAPTASPGAPAAPAGDGADAETSVVAEAMYSGKVTVRAALVDGIGLCLITRADNSGSLPGGTLELDTAATLVPGGATFPPATFTVEPLGTLEMVDGDPVIPCLTPEYRCHDEGVLDDDGYTTFSDCETLEPVRTFEDATGEPATTS